MKINFTRYLTRMVFGKIKKFPGLEVKKIPGGKQPVKLVEEFITNHGFDPKDCLQDKSSDTIRWMITINEGAELEILAENLNKPAETTIYLGLNIATVPIRGAFDMLAAALELADGLVGTKLSLVGHYLVLSSTIGFDELDADRLEHSYKLIEAQESWFKESLAEELGLETLPED